MENVTANIFTETKIRGCNPSFVTTSDGVVVIDTPQLPTRAVQMRNDAEQHGPIRYVINTEHHVDHIFGNYYFKDTGQVVHHQGVYDNFMVVTPELDPYAYAAEAIPTDDPEGETIFPNRDDYYQNPNKGTIVFDHNLTLQVGGHTFELIHTPGHTPGQIAVHIPQERALFTGDTIFHDCQTWLMTSNIDQWLTALDTIEQLDIDHLIPGHGPVTTKNYIPTQRSMLLEWKTAVAVAIAKGWTRDETIEKVHFKNRYPVDIGQEYMMDYINTHNAASLYDKLTTT
jgi:cyclase